MGNEPRENPDRITGLLHQLNNDLSLVMGHVDLASRLASDVAEGKLVEKLEAVKSAARRMAVRIRAHQASAQERVEQAVLS